MFEKLILEYENEISEEDVHQMNLAIIDFEFKRIFDCCEYSLFQVIDFFFNIEEEPAFLKMKEVFLHFYKTIVCGNLDELEEDYGCLGYMIFIIKIMQAAKEVKTF